MNEAVMTFVCAAGSHTGKLRARQEAIAHVSARAQSRNTWAACTRVAAHRLLWRKCSLEHEMTSCQPFAPLLSPLHRPSHLEEKQNKTQLRDINDNFQ